MRLDKRPWPLVVIAAVAVAFAPALARLIDVGRTNEYAGHAMFVPLFSVLVAWSARDRLRAAAGPGDARGLLLVAVALGALGLGYSTGQLLAQGLALPVAVAGLVLWRFGTGCLRAAAFPVGFLVMVVPPPHVFVAAITEQLQMFAAGVAASVVRSAGIPIHQVGTFLELRSLTLQVAEVCNGLRFLLAILVLTAALGQVTLPTWRRRVVLVATAVPTAILANAARVAAIAVGVHYVGPDAASGTLHNWIGKGVWALTLLPLVGLGLILARWPKPLPSARPAAVPPGKTELA